MLGGGSLLHYYNGSLRKLLQTLYPDLSWSIYRFSTPHQIAKGKSNFSKVQYLLYQQIQKLFYGFAVEFNYKYSEKK